MASQNELKQKAANRAAEFVKSGMVVGLGSGSTANLATRKIGERLKSGEVKNIVGIPSSARTEQLAIELQIPLVGFDKKQQIDLTIDGADEVDPDLNLIKGGGGALLREKVVAQASRQNIIIVDDSKLSSRLGTTWALPIEVIVFACRTEASFLNSLGASVSIRGRSDGSNFITDQKNLILDADFGPISDPAKLAFQLNERAGIVEHGLFLNLASDVIVADASGIRHLKRQA
ncbi:MAG: ribose-5-phosphate isomerase RpiA [bacterium]|nr:ribose-5-phosphate isomerase RpiA [bacterium]